MRSCASQTRGYRGPYGGLTSTIPRLYEIAKKYKDMGVYNRWRHHFVDENIEHALRNGIDIVVIGEGDRTIQELLECFEKGKPVRCPGYRVSAMAS